MFETLGMKTLPLIPGTKRPARSGWKNRTPETMWQYAPADANIGLRAGGELRVAFIDLDEKNQPGTTANANRWLTGLGLLQGEYPIVETPSGGAHIYVRLTGSLSGHSRLLAEEFGAGEFRYGSGAYVVAPPSQLADRRAYCLTVGDFRQLPVLTVADLRPILAKGEKEPGHLPIAPGDPNRAIPHLASTLLTGQGIERYRSRSEAEQAILTALVNRGFSFEEILALFSRYPGPGKFQELLSQEPKTALAYLEYSYQNARVFSITHESPARELARQLLQWADSVPWPGRTGSYDRAVYKAHAAIALRASRTKYGASARELAELAGTTALTASRASKRLEEAGLIRKIQSSLAGRSARYELVKNITVPQTPVVRDCIELEGHDAFRRGALGKTAAAILCALQSQPATIEELVRRTGRSQATVRRCLQQMSVFRSPETGQAHPLVVAENGIWKAAKIDLDLVAKAYGTTGTAERERRKHQMEREAFNRNGPSAPSK